MPEAGLAILFEGDLAVPRRLLVDESPLLDVDQQIAELHPAPHDPHEEEAFGHPPGNGGVRSRPEVDHERHGALDVDDDNGAPLDGGRTGGVGVVGRDDARGGGGGCGSRRGRGRAAPPHRDLFAKRGEGRTLLIDARSAPAGRRRVEGLGGVGSTGTPQLAVVEGVTKRWPAMSPLNARPWLNWASNVIPIRSPPAASAAIESTAVTWATRTISASAKYRSRVSWAHLQCSSTSAPKTRAAEVGRANGDRIVLTTARESSPSGTDPRRVGRCSFRR